MIPRFTHENFRQALLYLLPMGPIWSREPGSLCHYWASIIGQVYVRNSDRAIELLQVSFPGTATELLDEWEKTVGLPDPCVGEVTDLQLRQRLVVDRLVSSVDSNINFYIMYAKKYFGFDITIDQFTPFRLGTHLNRPLGGEDWSHTWRIRSDQDLKYLPCIFNRISPTHTLVYYGLFQNEKTN